MTYTVRTPTLLLLILLFAAFGTGGCGGNSDSSPGVAPDNADRSDPPLDNQPSSRLINGVVKTVQSPATIVIDDFTINIDNARIRENGFDVPPSRIAVGDLLTVTVDDRFVASLVDLLRVFVGPVDRVDEQAEVIVALGQRFHYNAGTSFDGALPSELSPGNMISVSGIPLPGGRFIATHVRWLADAFGPPPGDTIIVSGFAHRVDPATSTFFLGDLRIDFSQAELTTPVIEQRIYIAFSDELPDSSNVLPANRIVAWLPGLGFPDTPPQRPPFPSPPTPIPTPAPVPPPAPAPAPTPAPVPPPAPAPAPTPAPVPPPTPAPAPTPAPVPPPAPVPVPGLPPGIIPPVGLPPISVPVPPPGGSTRVVSQVNLQGVIARIISDTRFELNGYVVEHNRATTFVSGSAADLAVGRNVSVEGSFDRNNIVIARKIEILPTTASFRSLSQ